MTPPEPVERSKVCAIAVIAKAPRPGHVKTRLQGVLAPDEAAAMGAAFLRDTLGNVVAAGRRAAIAGYVAYAPAGQEARFDGMLPPGVALMLADGSQGEAPGVVGFGRVLLDTMRSLLGMGYGAACVLGADSPTLPTAALVRSAETLLAKRADAVLGAADDGGYYLLGLREALAAPFTDIAWSTEVVAAQTRARLAGLRMDELAPWYDVDDAAALTRLVREVSGGDGAEQPYAAPHTAALVERLGLRDRLAQHAA